MIRFTGPKLGCSRDSPAFEKSVNVLAGFNTKERKAFLQFTTGCSSLLPGKHHDLILCYLLKTQVNLM